jgi:AdoMet-dependent heme synthase
MSTRSSSPLRVAQHSRPTAVERTSAQVVDDLDAFPDHPGFQQRPLQVTWEMTQAHNWKSAPARAAARTPIDRNQFSTAEGFHLVEEVAAMRVPLLALTGGDPLLRQDLFPIIEFASRRSVRASLTLLPTPLLDAETIAALKASGLMRAGFWLHGSTAVLDDAYWAVPGAHRRTLDLIGSCHEVQLPVQANTIMARRNFHDVDPMIDFAEAPRCGFVECLLSGSAESGRRGRTAHWERA